jgi:hypothetical protein
MLNSRKYFAAFCFVVGAASTMDAQARGQVGLSLAYPGSFGLLWHPADRFALRSDLLLAKSKNESINGVQRPWAISVGLSGLVYLFRVDSLHGYVVPRFSYSKSGGENSQGSHGYTVSGALGLQGQLSRRVSVFGETGIRYFTNRQRIQFAGEPAQRNRTDTWSTTAGVGLLLYFR